MDNMADKGGGKIVRKVGMSGSERSILPGAGFKYQRSSRLLSENFFRDFRSNAKTFEPDKTNIRDYINTLN